MEIILVGIGGFAGAVTRFVLSSFISETVIRRTGLKFPFGTAFVNITGSFLLAFSLTAADLSPSLRLLTGTGFFGTYTTYSTFATETVILSRRGQPLMAVFNVLLNTLLCVGGAVLGFTLARLMH